VPVLAERTRIARRNQVLVAALACFARRGYHATTMSDVAAEAGVSKGMPYLYFPSKEALYIALQTEWNCALGERVDAAIAGMPEAERRSPRSVLRTVIATIGAQVTEEQATCRVLMEAYTLAAYHPAIAVAVGESSDRAQSGLERLVRQGIEAGEWPVGTDAALQTRLITGSLHGLMAQWHLAPGSFDWDRVADVIAGRER
jgi:AcrR family transcriptional regulator